MSTESDKLFSNIKFSFQQPAYNKPVMREVKGQDYITWGNDNKYPDFLLDQFEGSSLNNAIIIRKLSEIVGKGLYSELNVRGINKFIEKCNVLNESLNDIFYKCVRDFIIFGGFSIQVVYTKATGKIAEIYYKDISKLRFTPDQDKIKEAKNWGLQRVSTLTHDIYNPLDPTGRKIFYYRGNLTRDVYPKPQYCGALSAIQADILISDFWLSQIQNGLYPGLHIDFKNGNPAPEVKDALERDLQAKFGGNANAGRMFITFSDTQNPGPTINPIPQPDLDKQFVVLNDSIQSKIFQGHGLPPVLLGVPTPGKLGATNEVVQAAQQFRNNTVEPLQATLVNVFNNLLSANFEDVDIAILPLKPIGAVITDQIIITSQMTPAEIRKQMKDMGYIDNIDVPEGETVIGDIAAQTETDRKLLKPEQDPAEENHTPIPSLENPQIENPTNGDN